jgi:WhiB family redox-sensing transcriptional regulator
VPLDAGVLSSNGTVGGTGPVRRSAGPSELLVLLQQRPGWMADAACREPDPGVSWYPARGESAEPAKAVCAGCLVRAECLAFAEEHEDYHRNGIWGGLSANERRAARTPGAAPAA